QEQAEAGGPGRGGRTPLRLGPKDLAAVLDVVEQALRDRHLLSQAEVHSLESKKDLARRVEVLNLAMRPRQPGPGGGQPWMSNDVAEAMIDAISSEKTSAQLKAGPQNMDRRWRLIG